MSMFEPNRLAEYTDDALISEIRRVAAIVAKPKLFLTDFHRISRVHSTTLRNRFGGWREALEAADLAHLYNEPCLSGKSHKQLARGMSTTQLLETMKAVAAKLGKGTLTAQEFDEHAAISKYAICRHFGTWSVALEQAGLASVAHGRRYTDEECFENMLMVWTHYARQPEYREMRLPPSRVSGKAYTLRWGTWNKAIHAFVRKAEGDLQPPEGPADAKQPSVAAPVDPSPSPPTESDRQEIRLGLRYAVLKRDSFRCVLCGRSPATHLGIDLHVDHIHAHSKGGKTVMENLRSTCMDCNIGKGSKD
jgi:hypothetical protein